MVDVAPFRGLRYADGVDLAEVTAPPYDAIDDALADELRQRHPHNVVRLERGAGTGRGAGRVGADGSRDPYRRVADTYRRWLDEGVLVPDRDPRLYVYDETFLHDGVTHRQRGVLAALRLRPWGSREVLPHERIFRPAVEDRLRLMEALPANTSPVFGLTAREPREVASTLDDVMRDRPDVDFHDPDGVRHRMWVVSDRDVHASIAAGYREATLLMADGHHRYTTALEFRETHDVPGADRILTYIVGGAGPVIRPSHRVVRAPLGEVAAEIGRSGLQVHPVPAGHGSDDRPDTVEASVHAALEGLEGPGFVVVAPASRGDVRISVVTETETGDAASLRTAADADPAARDLDATLLQGVLTAVFDLDVGGDEVDIVPDTTDAITAVTAGGAATSFLVRPVDVGRVRAVAEAGGRMPPKSTSFHPKPRTGLVIRALHDTVHT